MDLDPKFHEETRSIHQEHEDLVAQLDQMDAALDQMVCYAEVFTDLATANQAISRGKWMAEWLSRHYEHEETTCWRPSRRSVRSWRHSPARWGAE
jgi:hypothetical protein